MTTGGPLDSRPKYNVVINCYVIFVSLGIYCDILDNWILIPEMTRVKIFKNDIHPVRKFAQNEKLLVFSEQSLEHVTQHIVALVLESQSNDQLAEKYKKNLVEKVL